MPNAEAAQLGLAAAAAWRALEIVDPQQLAAAGVMIQRMAALSEVKVYGSGSIAPAELQEMRAICDRPRPEAVAEAAP
ncbi:MAG: hypothetical protein KDB70_04140 [Mycobacterium sp.]|nr:hypothetical protein [Mycobacterium sp.]